MSKADEQAISRYPVIKGERADDILMKRIAYTEGYNQALLDMKRALAGHFVRLAEPSTDGEDFGERVEINNIIGVVIKHW